MRRIVALTSLTGETIRHCLLALCSCLLLSGFCSWAVAETGRLTIVIGDDDDVNYLPITRRFEDTLRANLGEHAPRITILTTADDPKALSDSDFLLSLGTRAAMVATQYRGDTPLLCALISRAAFQATVRRHYPSLAEGLADGIAALYLDQPKQRLFQLARLILPTAESAGTPLGPILKSQKKALQAAAGSAGFVLSTVVLQADGNPVAALDQLVSNADVIVALPDKVEANRQAAKWLLYLSFRRQKPLIGYSRRFTEAGAIASVYSSGRDVAEEAASITGAMIGQPGAGSIHWPGRFSVSTNLKVARSLKLSLQANTDYERELAKWGNKE